MSTLKHALAATWLTLVLGSGGATASVLSFSGAIDLLPAPPPSVAQDALESDEYVRVFLENEGLTLGSDLSVDIVPTGTATTYHPDGDDAASVEPGVIPAGTVVDSYFFHTDQVSGALVIGPGDMTFCGSVLGVVVFPDGLDATDSLLGAPGTTYGPYSGNRGLGPNGGNPDDVITLSGDGLWMTVDSLWATAGAIDQLRVITVHADPGGTDCNSNGIPDGCDIAGGTSSDCDTNAVPDECDVAGGAPDCNTNLLPDSCDPDCDTDGLPDGCETNLAHQDCDEDGICNGSDIAGCPPGDLTCADCNTNNIPDGCEPDCNVNDIADECDIRDGTSLDRQPNGIPDECELLGDPCELVKLSGGGALKGYGRSVGYNGAHLIVGSLAMDGSQHDGHALIYHQAGVNLVLDVIKDPAYSIASRPRFGYSVAVCSHHASAGAPHDEDLDSNGTIPNTGAVYSWQCCHWVGGSGYVVGDAGDTLGWDLALSDEFSLWGAPGAGASDAGQVRIDPGGTLEPSDGATNDKFGVSVAVSGNVAVVGAYRHDAMGSNSGAAYVFRYEGANWTEEAKLLASDGAAGDYFGYDVDVNGDTIVVGAPQENPIAPEGTVMPGAAYVFKYDGLNWVEQAKLLASDGAAEDYFGQAVAVADGLILIGAPGDDDNGAESGAVYPFLALDPEWLRLQKILGTDTAAGDEFGFSLVLSNEGPWGTTAVIGAPQAYVSATASGAVYLVALDGPDCNTNGTIDACEIAAGTSLDCNTNSIPDDCDPDCNTDGVPDDCTPAPSEQDCDTDGICNGVEIADCPPADPTCADCNANDVPDQCDTAGGTSADANTNGIPDECASSVRSCRDHGLSGPLCLDLSDNSIEPRTGGVTVLELDLDSAAGFGGGVTATCVNAGDVSGYVQSAQAAGDTVTVTFDPALPAEDACTVELDCGAAACVRACEGDLNRSGSTTLADAFQVKIRFGQVATDSNCEWDFDRSGSITTTDALQIKIRFGYSAPECP